jgi:hypothetical protein
MDEMISEAVPQKDDKDCKDDKDETVLVLAIPGVLVVLFTERR